MTKRFATARPGDPWRARDVNEMRRALERLDRASVQGAAAAKLGGAFTIQVDKFLPLLVELDEDLEADQHGKTANLLRRNSADDAWEDSQVDLEIVAEAQEGVYLEGERHVVLPHAASGRRLVLPGVHWHLGVTDAAIAASGGSGSVTLWRVDDDTEAATTLTVTAWNFFGVDVPADTRCMVIQHLQSRRWYVFAADCP